MFDLTDKESTIRNICVTQKVKKLELFGSAITQKHKTDSDIDFLVEFDEAAKPNLFNNYFELKFRLEKLLQRNVDVIMKSAIKNPFFKKGIKNTRLVYER